MTNEEHNELHAWRQRALTRGGTGLALVSSVAMFGYVAPLEFVALDGVVYALSVGLLWVVGLWRSASMPVRGALLCGALLIAFVHTAIKWGFVVGTPMLGLLCLVVAALFTSPRLTFGVWITVVGALAGVVGLRTTGAFDGYQSAVGVFPEPDVARRFVITTALYSGVVGACVSTVVTMMSRSIEMLNQKRRELDMAQKAQREAMLAQRAAQEEIVSLQKMDLIGKLAAALAHDFNNDLQVITGWSYVLGYESETPEEVDEASERLESSIRHASELVHQMLTLGRRNIVTAEVVSISNLFDTTASSLRRLLPMDVKVAAEIDEELFVEIDPIQLQQVLLNLSLNARDAMPDGGSLSLRASASAGIVTLEIEDTGTGIPEELRAKIFEPFFTTKSEDRGTGLGLATVRRIIEESGGVLRVESEVGVGTTFVIELDQVENHTASEEVERSVLLERLDGIDLVVVDDDPHVREVVTRFLGSSGATVRAAADALDAIDLIDEKAPDLVLSDAIMPRGGIVPLLEYLDGLGEGAPGLLVSSAYIEDELVRRGIEARELTLLRKPFSPRELVEHVRLELELER